MKFGHLNVRSILTGFEQLKDYIINVNFEFFAVSETWLNININTDLLLIPGYRFIRVDRNGRGGGLGIFIKEFFQYKIILQQINDNLEQLWIRTTILGNRYAIGVLYRPPTSNILQSFDALENAMSVVLPECDTVLFAGDLNINLLNDSPGVNHFHNFIESYDLHQLITEPTRFTATTQTLIDVIITSDNLCVNSGKVVNLHGISDHCVTICDINKLITNKINKMVTFRSFKDFDEHKFFALFHSINWNYIYQLNDVNSMVEFLNENIISIFNINAPLRTVRVTKPPAPWLTYNIREMMKVRDKAFNKYKMSKSLAHWNYYKDLKNEVNYAIRREKKAYMEFTLAQKNSKSTWNALRSLKILNKDNKYDIPNNLLDLDLINTHFTNTHLINKTATQINITEQYKNAQASQNLLFEFASVEKKDVIKCLNSIKSNSVGVDLISLKMIKLVSIYLIDHLTFIMNCALTTAVFPEAWKQANVLPLAKIPNPTELGHLRPISLLPTLSKVLEDLMKTQITQYVFQNNIVPNSQSGFREQHSTTTALATITDDLIRATDEGKISCLILLDYSKAFDSMDPNILCNKLLYYGFSQNSVTLIKSYLHNRRQRIVYGNNISEYRHVNLGVPQGSILGPLLFSIYISDFHKVIKNCNIHNYADDTQAYFSFTIDDSLPSRDKINNDLVKLVDISAAHNLKLNASKSYVMLFGPKHKRDHVNTFFKIKINGEDLPIITEAKNLGLWIDSDMRFTKHVNYLCKSSYNILRQLYPHRSILNSKLKLNICEALIISKLSYCDAIYGPALLKFDSDRLQKIQNSCFRFAYGIKKYEHISFKIAETKKLKLDKLRNVHLLSLVHKVLLSNKPIYLYLKLNRFRDVNSFKTRNTSILVIPRHSTAMFKRCFTYVACKLYNGLPARFQNYSIVNFKKKLKAFFLEQ